MDAERFRWAISLRDTGKIDEALQELTLLGDGEDNPYDKSSLLLNQASCLLRLGRLAEARERWSKSVKYGSNVYTEYVYACLCTEEGLKDEALRRLIALLENSEELRQPANEDLYSEASERVGYLLFDQGQYSRASERFNKALIYPDTEERSRKLRFYLGFCELELGHLDSAEQRLTESLPPDCNDPLWAEVQLQLGRLYFQRGAYLNAKKAFDLSKRFAMESNIEMQRNISMWLAAVARYLPQEHL